MTLDVAKLQEKAEQDETIKSLLAELEAAMADEEPQEAASEESTEEVTEELPEETVVEAAAEEVEEAEAPEPEEVPADIQVDLPEVFKYKILHFLKVENERYQAIRTEILTKLGEEMVAQLSADEEYQAARKSRIETINDLLTTVGEDLPEGFAVTGFSLDEDTVIASYAPDQVGKLLNT